MMRTLLATAVLGGWVCAAAPAGAYTLRTSSGGSKVRWWDDEIQFALRFDDHAADLPAGAAADAARRALATWSAAGGPVLTEAASDDDSAVPIRFTMGPGDPQRDQGALALTNLTFDPGTGQIQAAEITVNAIDFRWSVDDACDDRAYDLESTLAHELGHALGLAHSTDPDATMNTYVQPCETGRRTLAPDDLAAIADLYGDPPPTASDDPTGCAVGGRAAGLGPSLALIAGLLLVRRRRR